MDWSGGHTTQLQTLLDQMKAGDVSARDQIINASCERLRRLTRKMLKGYLALGRWEQTDDVLQTSVLRLHRSLAQVQPDSVRQFFGLAATQIRRTLIDLARHHFGPEGPAAHHHTNARGLAADDPGEPLQQVTAADGEPETLEAWTRFHQAVEALPEEEREVFDLLWYQGLPQTEAATVLGVTERTVGRRWQSARCLLYEAMKGQKPE